MWQSTATLDIVILLAVALFFAFGFGAGEHEKLFARVRQFLAQRRRLNYFVLGVGALTVIHLVYEYFASANISAFDWDYFISFMFGQEHDHSILEIALAFSALALGIGALKDKSVPTGAVRDLVIKALQEDKHDS